MRRALRIVALCFAVVIAIPVLAEVALRTGAALGGPGWPIGVGGKYFVILCVGDSHTYGLGHGYPETLGKLLAERSPRYRVINVGVAGQNTASVRRHFVDYLDRFRPRIVIHWAGVNNNWNAAEKDVQPGSELTLEHRVLGASRLIQLVRARRLDVELTQTGALVVHQLVPRNAGQPESEVTGTLFGVQVLHRFVKHEEFPVDEVTSTTERDVRWMAERCQERGIPFVVMAYPLWGKWFVAVNTGVRKVAEEKNLPIIETLPGTGRLNRRYAGREQEMPKAFDKSVHPTQALYDEIAGMVVEKLDTNGWLPW